MFDNTCLCYDVGIFSIHIKQVRLVRAIVTIAACITDDYRNEAAGDGVDTGCPNTAASREAGNDKRIDLAGGQRRRQRSAEEGTWILFRNHQLAGSDFQAGRPVAHRASCNKDL